MATWPIILLSLVLSVERGALRGPCDPLVPEYCLLPFPNSFFTSEDPRSETGLRVNLSSASFPTDSLGRSTDVKEWNGFDGFSPFPSILAYFSGVSDSNLPHHWDMAASMRADSPSVLLDAHTGERVAHFAELDTAAGLSRRALMIWPAKRLRDSWRYIVAMRYLRNDQGELLSPSAAFQALRDNITTGNPDIDSRASHFEDIFTRLESTGVVRATLQLAWDFTTASLNCLTKRLLSVRDDAFARVGIEGPRFLVLESHDNYSENIYRRIQGSMKVPLYTNTPLPGAHLIINSKGLPVYQGMADALFTVLIPHSVANGSRFPASVVQYGHGLFGSQKEVESGYLQSQANRYGYIMVACDWWGMSELDVPAIVTLVSDSFANFRILPDRLTQGTLNMLLLMRAVKGGLSSDPHMIIRGHSVVDPKLTHYYGNSLGGILGVVYMAASTDVTRGVLGVSGGPFGLLLPRSADFKEFEILFRVLYPDPVDFISVMAAINMLWSRLEPSAYMASITSDPLPGTPTHRVLYQYALGDAQVNILGLYSIARSANAVMFSSNVRETFSLPTPAGATVTERLYGFPFLADNITVTQDSVAMGFDCGAPPEPSGNTPPNSDTDTHNGPRNSLTAQAMIDLFLRSGTIKNLCGGMCKCKR